MLQYSEMHVSLDSNHRVVLMHAQRPTELNSTDTNRRRRLSAQTASISPAKAVSVTILACRRPALDRSECLPLAASSSQLTRLASLLPLVQSPAVRHPSRGMHNNEQYTSGCACPQGPADERNSYEVS